MAVGVTAFGRIHLGLLAPTAVEGVIDGGLGLALQAPAVQVRVSSARRPQIEAEPEVAEVIRPVVSRFAMPDGYHLRARSDIPRHIGLGSGTQIALATAEACARFIGEELSHEQLSERAGRGNTSKVGCAAYSGGGLILDLGRLASSKISTGPSGFAKLHYQQSRTLRFEFPDWDVMLCMPLHWPRVSGAEEHALFNRLARIPRDQVYQTSFTQMHRLVPAVLEHNLQEFDGAVRLMRTIGFKRREIAHRGSPARTLIQLLEAAGLSGVTMSSWGGTMVGFSKGWSARRRRAVAAQIEGRCGVQVLWTRSRNEGRLLEVDG